MPTHRAFARPGLLLAATAGLLATGSAAILPCFTTGRRQISPALVCPVTDPPAPLHRHQSGGAAGNIQVIRRPSAMQPSKGLSEREALRIAVERLNAKRLMLARPCKVYIGRADQRWVLWFVFLPETPGMDITVFVSDQRKVEFLPGL
jgi:hypothetical protein